jgi:hypothetical protein
VVKLAGRLDSTIQVRVRIRFQTLLFKVLPMGWPAACWVVYTRSARMLLLASLVANVLRTSTKAKAAPASSRACGKAWHALTGDALLPYIVLQPTGRARRYLERKWRSIVLT